MILEWIFVQTQKTFAGVGVGMVFVGDFFFITYMPSLKICFDKRWNNEHCL